MDPLNWKLSVSVLTPPGRAAIATIAVEGEDAVDVVSRLFEPAGQRSLRDSPPGCILFGRWSSGGDLAEELVVTRRGPRRLEIHCHGGQAAVQAVVAALQDAGGRATDWQQAASQWEEGAIERDARVALAATRTERTAAILLDQYRGALRQAVEELRADCDRGQKSAASDRVAQLLRYAGPGRHLTAPYRVVLAGMPNVGKSTLGNALLGYERSIVDAVAGTTRDVLTSDTSIDGWPVEISDTAGLRTALDAIEAQGVERARAQLARADLVLLITDGSQDWKPEETAVLEALPEALVVHNKCDLPQSPGARPGGLEISASTGVGIKQLVQRMGKLLVPEPPHAGAAVPFTDAQITVLRQAAEAVARDDLRSAAVAVTGLLGR